MIKKPQIFFTLFISFLLSIHITFSQTITKEALKNKIANIIHSNKSDIGVAILDLETGDSLSLNGNKHYPMQSVFKFPLAIAVLHQIEKGKLSLNQIIFIKKESLDTNTYSPIVADYPNKDINITLRDLLIYTVSKSDNNGCDILFRLLGGPKNVNNYIHRLGIKEMAIAATEAEMKKGWAVQYTDWSTPVSAVLLLEKFYNKNILSKVNRDYLWNLMIASVKLDRIKGALPDKATVAHKAGTSGTNNEGIRAAFNDIGIVALPNGKHFAIAVFISNSKENENNDMKVIADISKLAYEYFLYL